LKRVESVCGFLYLGCETALAGHVHNEEDFASELGQRPRVSIDMLRHKGANILFKESLETRGRKGRVVIFNRSAIGALSLDFLSFAKRSSLVLLAFAGDVRACRPHSCVGTAGASRISCET